VGSAKEREEEARHQEDIALKRDFEYKLGEVKNRKRTVENRRVEDAACRELGFVGVVEESALRDQGK